MSEQRCPHDSRSGDEGPIAELGRWPERWRCDECGEVIYDRVESVIEQYDIDLDSGPGVVPYYLT